MKPTRRNLYTRAHTGERKTRGWHGDVKHARRSTAARFCVQRRNGSRR